MFRINFGTDNAAFDDEAGTETCRILRSIAKNIENGDLYGPVRDINGNLIGNWELNGN